MIRRSWAANRAFAGCASPSETIVGLLASGEARERILEAYPYLEAADLDECLSYAAWRLEEREDDLVAP